MVNGIEVISSVFPHPPIPLFLRAVSILYRIGISSLLSVKGATVQGIIAGVEIVSRAILFLRAKGEEGKIVWQVFVENLAPQGINSFRRV